MHCDMCAQQGTPRSGTIRLVFNPLQTITSLKNTQNPHGRNLVFKYSVLQIYIFKRNLVNPFITFVLTDYIYPQIFSPHAYQLCTFHSSIQLNRRNSQLPK